MKKEKNTQVANFIGNKVAEQLQQIKGQTQKATKTESSKEIKSKPKLVEHSAKAKKETKEKVIKEVKAQQKPSILEEVISHREVKYVYPEDITDTLARKKWRQQTRNELHRLEREMFRIKDQNSKEFKDAAKKFEDFKKTVLKPEQVA